MEGVQETNRCERMQDKRQPFEIGTHVHVVTASGLHFRGPVLLSDEDTLTIHDLRTDKKVAFAWRTLQLVSEEEESFR